jgi:hypothetical protein
MVRQLAPVWGSSHLIVQYVHRSVHALHHRCLAGSSGKKKVIA